LESGGSFAAQQAGVALLSVLEVAGCAFVGFLYTAILATAITRKTRRHPTQPAHPENEPASQSHR